MPFDLRADQPLDGADHLLVVLGDDGESGTQLAGAPGAPDPVDIIIRMERHVIVEHMAHGLNVEPARRNIRCDQNVRAAGLERIERRHPGALVQIAMQCHGLEIMPQQRAVQVGNLGLPVGEDDCGVEVFGIRDQAAQRLALLEILGMGGHQPLRDRRSRSCRLRGLDAHRIVQELFCDAGDFRRHRGREEQRLPCEGHQLRDALDVGDEAHVEHPVGLVDHENLDAREQELAALIVIEKAARCRDQHIDTARDLYVLIIEGHAADQQRHAQLVVDAILDEVFLDLSSEFARRLEDQRARHPGTGAALFQHRDHRQCERGGLASAGLRDAQHIAAGHDMRYGLFLDWRRRGVPG